MSADKLWQTWCLTDQGSDEETLLRRMLRFAEAYAAHVTKGLREELEQAKAKAELGRRTCNDNYDWAYREKKRAEAAEKQLAATVTLLRAKCSDKEWDAYPDELKSVLPEKVQKHCGWCNRPIKSGEYCRRHRNAEPRPGDSK